MMDVLQTVVAMGYLGACAMVGINGGKLLILVLKKIFENKD